MNPKSKYPIRMRAYYRALKRKEEWALKIDRLRGKPIQHALALYFRNMDGLLASLMNERNPFLSLSPKDDFGSKYIPVPLFYGK